MADQYKRDKNGKITHFQAQDRNKETQYFPVDEPSNPVDQVMESANVGGWNKDTFDRKRKEAQDARDSGS